MSRYHAGQRDDAGGSGDVDKEPLHLFVLCDGQSTEVKGQLGYLVTGTGAFGR